MFAAAKAFISDARHFQILFLGCFLTLALFRFGIDLSATHAIAGLGAGLLTQYLFTRDEGFDPRSALISCLSLCLLLRTNDPILTAAAASLAIGSKFVFKTGNKHFFNPTNLAIAVFCVLGVGWISPGQWGGAPWFALMVAGLGMLVVTRAARWDTALVFLAAYAAIIYGRAWWLGDPWSIPLHQLKSGSLLIFAFFMITDPRSTPSAWVARLFFAVAVAVLAAWFRFSLYEPNGLIYALFLASLTTPLLDKAFPAPVFSWRAPKKPQLGESHA